MRFEDVLGRTERSELEPDGSGGSAWCERTNLSSLAGPLPGEGPSGLADRRLRPSLRQAPRAEIERMPGHSCLPAEFLVGRP